MPPSARRSAEITIHWYLGYLSKRWEPASIESARAFMAEIREGRPEETVSPLDLV